LTPDSLRVEGLHYAYPNGPAVLDGLNLVVEAGERVALLGPNGSGKTTLLHQVTGILEAEAGTVDVGGLRLDDATCGEIRARVGVVFQDADDQLFMPTVRHDVAFGPANLGLTGTALEETVLAALAAVNATALADRSPHHLSVGEKRRVALATVLAMDPSVLLLDEPSAGLDPKGRRELIELLSSIDQTQMIVTHDLLLALELCGRALLLSGGRVVADRPPLDLLTDVELLAQHRLELPLPLDRPTLVTLLERVQQKGPRSMG